MEGFRIPGNEIIQNPKRVWSEIAEFKPSLNFEFRIQSRGRHRLKMLQVSAAFDIESLLFAYAERRMERDTRGIRNKIFLKSCEERNLIAPWLPIFQANSIRE